MLQIFGWQSDSNKLTCCHAYSCVLVERKWLMFTCEWWELFVTMSDNAWQCVTMRVLVNDDICLWQCVTMCYNAWQCMTIRDWCRCVYSWMMRSVRDNASKFVINVYLWIPQWYTCMSQECYPNVAQNLPNCCCAQGFNPPSSWTRWVTNVFDDKATKRQ